MVVKLLTEQRLAFQSLKGGCRGSSESTHVKMHLKKICRGMKIMLSNYYIAKMKTRLKFFMKKSVFYGVRLWLIILMIIFWVR